MRLPGSFKRLRVRLSDLYQSLRYPLPKDLKRVRKANKIANRYMPSPPRFNGRLVLFRASHRAYGLVPDPLIGWGAVAEGRIEVIEVEGHHDTLLWEPKVGNTARLLKQLLEETRPIEQNDRKD